MMQSSRQYRLTLMKMTSRALEKNRSEIIMNLVSHGDGDKDLERAMSDIGKEPGLLGLGADWLESEERV